MCTVSMVGDHYRDIWRRQSWFPAPGQTVPTEQVTRQEFEELKRQVSEMKELLRRAKEYDEANGEPDCEIDEKMELLRRIADVVGVDITEVIGKGTSQ